MRSLPLWILLLVCLVPALVACGSSGDDDDDDDDPSDAGPGASGSSSGTKKGGDADVKLPEIKAATYSSGKMQIEVSGDKSQKLDLDGSGLAQDGFAFFNYGSDKGGVSGVAITMTSGDAEDSPGGFTFSTSEFATAGEWGNECKVSFEQFDGKAKGEFSCDTIDAVQPGGTKVFRVKVKGTFTAGP